MGAGFPEQFISISRTSYAELPRQEKSLVMSSSHKSLKSEKAAANMRRLFGSREEEGRQEALLTDEAGEPLGSGGDLDAWTAYRKAEKPGAGKRKMGDVSRRGGGEVRGDGQTSNGFNRLTRKGNRCYRRDSEYHLAPKMPAEGYPERGAQPGVSGTR